MMYVVSYDVREDRRRHSVSETLLDFGHRVQYSVFECSLDEELLQRMLERLSQLIVADEDQVRVYPMCATCRAGIRTLGQPGADLEPKAFII